MIDLLANQWKEKDEYPTYLQNWYYMFYKATIKCKSGLFIG